MKKIDLGQSIGILANLGVIAGIVFLAVEVRTNTATNQIAMYQASSANWMQIDGLLASDENLVTLLDKAFSGGELNTIEARRFEAWIKQQLTHAAFVRRLFESGLYSEAEFRLEFGDVRGLARLPGFRDYIEGLPPSGFRSLILADEAEFGRLLAEVGAMEIGAP
jgi:hypothetical protein